MNVIEAQHWIEHALELAEGLDHRPRYGGRVSIPAAWAGDVSRTLTFFAGVVLGVLVEAPEALERPIEVHHVPRA